MKIIKQHNYYVEDMLPYGTVREHLRYDFGDAEDLIKSYAAAACDYMETLTNRVFCSSTPADLHEDPANGNLTEIPAALNATVTVYLDKSDIECVQRLNGVTGTYTLAPESLLYLDNTGNWVSMAGGSNAGMGDFTKVYNMLETYPITLDWTQAGHPDDINDREYNVYKFELTGGDNVRDLPRQYRQAMLLLVGHYDAHREAETLGAVTNELKEGVMRLLSSVKQY